MLPPVSLLRVATDIDHPSSSATTPSTMPPADPRTPRPSADSPKHHQHLSLALSMPEPTPPVLQSYHRKTLSSDQPCDVCSPLSGSASISTEDTRPPFDRRASLSSVPPSSPSSSSSARLSDFPDVAGSARHSRDPSDPSATSSSNPANVPLHTPLHFDPFSAHSSQLHFLETMAAQRSGLSRQDNLPPANTAPFYPPLSALPPNSSRPVSDSSGSPSQHARPSSSQVESVSKTTYKTVDVPSLMDSPHFGPGIKSKLRQMLECLIPMVSLAGHPDETVHIVEYGFTNSRSSVLVPDIIAHFNLRQPEPPLSFSVYHVDVPPSDNRSLSAHLNFSSSSYLDNSWQASNSPSLQDRVFSYFVTRPFEARVLPPRQASIGLSVLDLHWDSQSKLSEQSNPSAPGAHFPSVNSQAALAFSQLQQFLVTRASEFKSGGLLIVAYIQQANPRSNKNASPVSSTGMARQGSAPVRPSLFRMHSSPAPPVDDEKLEKSPIDLTSPSSVNSWDSTKNAHADEGSATNNSNSAHIRNSSSSKRPKDRDAWKAITSVLGHCIQRLVSCSMLSADTARHLLLDLPILARTPRQTQAVLDTVSHLWSVEWSCGLGDFASDGPRQESHNGYGHGQTISRGSDTDVMTLNSSSDTQLQVSPPVETFGLGSQPRPRLIPTTHPIQNQPSSSPTGFDATPTRASFPTKPKENVPASDDSDSADPIGGRPAEPIREGPLVLSHPACREYRRYMDKLTLSTQHNPQVHGDPPSNIRRRSGSLSDVRLAMEKLKSANGMQEVLRNKTANATSGDENSSPTKESNSSPSGRQALSEGICNMVKLLYESHFRVLLKEKGKLSRASQEWVLEALWEALREKVDEGALEWIELEFTLIALRKT